MKKHWIQLALAGMMILGLSIRVDAYEPHSMPGGKNYLASDNFPTDQNGAFTQDDIMVRPNAFYTLSIRTEYRSGGCAVQIGLLDNGVPYTSMLFEDLDFSATSDPNFWSVTFKTPPTVNYLNLSFSHSGTYFDTHTPGEFQLEEGTLFSGYEAYEEPTIYDAAGPVFIGMSVIVVNVDQPLTVNELLDSFTAYDAVSGDVTASIAVIADDYSANMDAIGTYGITIRAFDQAGNHTTVTFSVRVVDIAKPVISGPTEIIVAYPNTRTQESILAELAVSDNYDAPGSVVLSVVSNAYVGHETTLGDYAILFRATDSSGNTQTKEVWIRVRDQANPIITGPSTVSIGYHLVYSETDILNLFSVEDNHDGDITSELIIESNPYAAQSNQIGTYAIRLCVADSTGNESIRDLTIHVVDLIGPIVYYDTSVLTVYNNTHLLLSDITKLLIASSVLENRDYRATVLFDSYSKYARIPGVYHMEIEYVSDDREPSVQTLKIVVKEAAGDFIPGEDNPQTADSLTFWERNWGWFGSGFFLLATATSNLLWWKLKRKK